MKIGPVVSPFSNNVSNLEAKKGRPLTDSEVLGYSNQYGKRGIRNRNINNAFAQKTAVFQENVSNNIFKTSINTEQSTTVGQPANNIGNLEELQNQFKEIQAKYSVNNVQIPPQVQAKLGELGLASTGSYEADMANIQNSLATQNASSFQNSYYLNPNYILWFGK